MSEQEISDEIIELKKIIDNLTQYKKKYLPFEEFHVSNLESNVVINLLEDPININKLVDDVIKNYKKDFKSDNFFEILTDKLYKKTDVEIKNEIYDTIIKISSRDRIFYGNYADLDDIELIIMVILSEALIAKKNYYNIIKQYGTKEELEKNLKLLYIKKISIQLTI